MGQNVLPAEREVSMTRETAAYTAVSDALWMQRETLQLLLYRLVCEKLLLTSGSDRWLARADDEVRAALDRLRSGELMRAAEVEELTRLRGLDVEASLAELAAAAPEPWRTLLADHRDALQTLVFEVQNVAEENRHLLDADRQLPAASDVDTAELATLTATSRAAYGAARATADDVRQLSLINFLR